jgi:hypothetical protein
VLVEKQEAKGPITLENARFKVSRVIPLGSPFKEEGACRAATGGATWGAATGAGSSLMTTGAMGVPAVCRYSDPLFSCVVGAAGLGIDGREGELLPLHPKTTTPNTSMAALRIDDLGHATGMDILHSPRQSPSVA